jgi:RHS repeat-associated protein
MRGKLYAGCWLGAIMFCVAATASSQTVSFLAPRTYAAGKNPQSVAVADFNGSSVLAARIALNATPFALSPGPTEPPGPQGVYAANSAAPSTVRVRMSDAYGKLPLSFETNRGQTDWRVKFVSRGQGYSLFLTGTETVLALRRGRNSGPAGQSGSAPRTRAPDVEKESTAAPSVLRMSLSGANPAPQVEGIDELTGKANYFIGNDPKKWRTNVPTYEKVRYRDVYPGVDLVYYGNQRQLEHDFIVAPGANPSSITLNFSGAEKFSLDSQGRLILGVKEGEVRFEKASIYQELDGIRAEISGGYVLKGERKVGFQVAAYDTSRPLIIDPVLVYSTYLGGSVGDAGYGIAVDAAGNAYVTGFTGGNFPTTGGAPQTTFGGTAPYTDAFVTKLNSTGTALVYSTYLGGSGNDEALGIAVDSSGNAYVTGDTLSSDFPTTPGAFQMTYGGCVGLNGCVSDAFVTKLNPLGTGLLYSTYLGVGDVGRGIAVDALGNAYVTGETFSITTAPSTTVSLFPTTAGAFQTACIPGTFGCASTAFVTQLNPVGTALLYSTFLGDSSFGYGIAVDAAGNAYVTGRTGSVSFPTTSGAFQTTLGSGSTAFVTKFNSTGSALVYSTYLGAGGDEGDGIAVDSSGNAYVAGSTASVNFPTTVGAFQPACNFGFYGCNSVFVAKLNPLASGAASLVYSTYLGGGGLDVGRGIAVDSSGNAYVTGSTNSGSFPTTAGAYQTTLNGSRNAFVTMFNSTGATLVYSTFLGGFIFDEGRGIAVDALGNTYVTGLTESVDFPTTSGAFQTNPLNNNENAFVAKIFQAPTMNTSSTVTSSANPSVFGQSVTFTATVSAVAPGSGTPTGTVEFKDGATSLGFVALVSGSVTFSTFALSVGTHSITAVYGGDANFNATGTGSSAATPLSQTVNAAPTTTTLTSLPNPSKVGQSVTFTAAVSSSGGAPTGMVTFFDGATAPLTMLGTGTLNASGQATLATAALSAGIHTITAVYSGDAIFASSTASGSSALTQTVQLNSTPPLSFLGPPGTPTNPTGMVAEPVNTATGNYYTCHRDLRVPGKGFAFDFTRCYNAQDTYSGPMGAGWTHSYNVFLTEDPNGTVTIKEGTGAGVSFTPTIAGSYSPATTGLFDSLRKNPDGSLTLTRKNQVVLKFSPFGKLLSIIDRNGNTQTLAYDGLGNLTLVTDTSGRNFSLAYDGSNHLVSMTDPIGGVVRYAYDASGNLNSYQDAIGGVTQYTYDSNHRMSSATDPRGVLYVQNTYDVQGRVLVQTNARGFATAFAYGSPSPGTTTITDGLGNPTQHIYDANSRLVKVVDAQGGPTSFAYDANNDGTSVTDPKGSITSITYDAVGNVTSMTNALGNSSMFTFDARNNLLSATNPAGQATFFNYDTNGNVTAIHDPLGGTSAYTYDTSGELTSVRDPLGNSATLQYDSSGNLIRVTNALGNSATLSYDGVGRLVSVKDANGHTKSALYDGLSRIVKVTDALGNPNQFTYDPIGNLLTTTNANGKPTSYTYDAGNNLVMVTDALVHNTSYSYDGNGNRTSFTNAKGKVTSYNYDALNRLLRVTNALSSVTSYSYDSVGNVQAITDAKGQTTQITHDAINQPIAISYADGTTVTNLYDANGNRVSMLDPYGATTYAYDALNRLTSVANPGGQVVAYAYDAAGNRKSLKYPDTKVMIYSFDQANRLSAATDWLGRRTAYNYDPAGNLIRTIYPNGTNIAYGYDASNRLTNVVNSLPGLPPITFAYSLDKVGNRKALNKNGVTTAFSYDALNELVGAQLGLLKTTWTYDAVGNRSKQVSPLGTIAYTYNAADRLLTANAATLTYDANGNRVSETRTAGGQPIIYRYDAANRLVGVTGGAIASAFAYDGDGNRISQSIGSGTYGYVNDVATALPVVLQESGPDGNISYARGLGLISESSTSGDFFIHPDGLGSVVALSAASGKLSAAYLYDSWGNSLLTGPDTVGTKNKFRFTGEALDPGTKLYYLRARYYDPEVGRFINKDPFSGLAGAPLSTNRYIYAGNNPVTNVDHSGLSAEPGSSEATRSGGRIENKGTVTFDFTALSSIIVDRLITPTSTNFAFTNMSNLLFPHNIPTPPPFTPYGTDESTPLQGHMGKFVVDVVKDKLGTDENGNHFSCDILHYSDGTAQSFCTPIE